MKSLSDAAFFRAFDALVGEGNPHLRKTSWEHAGVNWRRDRFSCLRDGYSFTIETFMLAHRHRPRWTLLVAKEFWWGEGEHKALRSARWARPTEGRHADAMAWFRAREKTVEADLAASEKTPTS